MLFYTTVSLRVHIRSSLSLEVPFPRLNVCFYYIWAVFLLCREHTLPMESKCNNNGITSNEAKGFLFGDQVTYLSVIKKYSFLYHHIYCYIHYIFTTAWQISRFDSFFLLSFFLFRSFGCSLPCMASFVLDLLHFIFIGILNESINAIIKKRRIL